MLQKLIILVILVALGIGGYFYFSKNKPSFQPKTETETKTESQSDIFEGVGYAAVDNDKFDISFVASDLKSPSRVKITPDGKYLLVAQVTGEVLAFERDGSSWEKDHYEVVKVQTQAPGFPPEEVGLVGIVFSSEYQKTGKTFLLYTFKEGEKIKNRISVTTLSDKGGKLSGTEPELIFDANVEGASSHQITDGVGITVASKPQLMFLIGEGFVGTRAQDPKLEAGKLMIISEDGKDKKILALGVRNAYVISSNTFDDKGRYLIADTGPNKYDRIIYTKLFDADGKSLKQLNFNWNGVEESLIKPLPDPNISGVSDMVILRLGETRTFTGLIIHPGKGSIPNSDDQSQSVLATVFGQTGDTTDLPGREIWLGKLTDLTTQPKISFDPIIKRNPKAIGKIGNPVGLEVDSQTGDFFFLDILEGKLYQVKPK